MERVWIAVVLPTTPVTNGFVVVEIDMLESALITVLQLKIKC